MSFQGEAIGKGRGANVAFEGLLARVHFGVVLQMGSLTECGAALQTLVRFFTRMNSAMVPEGRMTCESLVAHLTHVRLFAAVCPLVVLQMRRLRKLHATGVAAVRFLARVNPHVVL